MTRINAGHSARWTNATLPATSLVARTSPESSSADAIWKIVPPCSCPHQLPRIGPPAMASINDVNPGSGVKVSTPCLRRSAMASLALPTLASTAGGRFVPVDVLERFTFRKSRQHRFVSLDVPLDLGRVEVRDLAQ